MIIVENIYRHITAHGADRSRPLIDRIIEASHEIERAAVLLDHDHRLRLHPALLDDRPGGRPVRPDGQHLRLRHLRRLCLAVTLAPVLCSFLFHNKTEETETFVDRIMKRRYLRTLNRVLDHRYLTLAVMGGAARRSRSLLIPALGGEFMPQLEEGNLWIRAIMPRTVSLEEAARIAPRLREVIASVPEVRGVMSQVGRPDDGTDVTSFFNLEFNVPAASRWRSGGDPGIDPARRSRTS